MSARTVPSRAARIAAWSAVALLVLATVVLIGWRLNGGRWVRVETASMGTEAPVGTLLWVAPVRFDQLRPGDLITFRPPGSEQTYSHLVRAVHADGTISTQGQITAPDPWRIGPDDVVGKVVLRWIGVGWLVLAAPVLLIGGTLVWVVAGRLRDPDLKLPVAVVGGAAVLAVMVSVYRPLTGAEQLSFVPGDGGARASYVATGLLPVRISATGAKDLVLRDGQTGSVLVPRADDAGRFAVTLRPQVPMQWWAVLVAACFAVPLGRLAKDPLRRYGVGTRNRP